MKSSGNSHNLLTPVLEVHLLGTTEFISGDRVLHLHATRKTISLFAYLLLHQQCPHMREDIATLFWGDVSDEQARHSLRTALATIRKELGNDLIVSDRETIQINPDIIIRVDALEFQKTADSDVINNEISYLQNAIDLYQGDLLAGFYDDWVLRERESYRCVYIDLLLKMAQIKRSHSEYSQAIEYAEKVLENDPVNERGYQHLIFCYLVSGDRSSAIRQYHECHRILQEELAVEPSPETTKLYHWITQTPIRALEAHITNLPIPITSFIGRAQEMTKIKDTLAKNRLVTLTGAGGCGKTRLAIQVASDLVDSFTDGVWWVDFGALTDAALIAQTIARALGVYEVSNTPISSTLVNHLRLRKLLLVLDNCEHMTSAIAEIIMTLLSSCIELKILTTSRETIGVLGEVLLRVPPLSFPKMHELLPVEYPEYYESVRLLIERALAVQPDFKMTKDNIQAVIKICQQLDGMPLAIELAAARVNVLPIQQIAALLEEKFNMLTAGSSTSLPRHRTLYAVIDWSYYLLTNEEQALLCRLSVYVGGWTLEAVESVSSTMAISHTVINLMSMLVNKSLVEFIEDINGEGRYRILETVRQYCLEKLNETGLEKTARRQHAFFFASLAEKAEKQLRGPEMQIWFDRLEIEHDNFRAALEWSLTYESAELYFRFAGALGIFWHRGYLNEGYAWLELLMSNGKDAPPELRVRAIAPASWLARDLGNYKRATTLNKEAIEISRTTGDKFQMVPILIQGGLLAVYQNDPRQALICLNEALAFSEELDFQWGRAVALVNLGHAALFNLQWNKQARSYCEESFALFKELGDATEQAHALIILGPGAHYENDDQRGRELVEQAINICRQAGDKRQLTWATVVLSIMMRWQGKIDESLSFAKEGLRLASELGEKTITIFSSIMLAGLAKDRGMTQQSLHLLGCAIRGGEKFGYHVSPMVWDLVKSDVDKMRAELGEKVFNDTWAEGAEMSLEAAIQDAIQV